MNSNGHDYVDLALPSGTMWATCNVGADKPEDDGLLFQFGRTDGYKYADRNNKFYILDNKNITGKKWINPTASGAQCNAGQKLSLEDDAAHTNMGGDWVMPTKADLQELYDNTKHEVVTINGKKGILYTSTINDNSIFVPFAGYWSCFDGKFYGSDFSGYIRSSEVRSSDDNNAWCIEFYFGSSCGIYYSPRADGYSVRGVIK